MEKTDEAMNYYDESLNINQHHNQALSFKGAALNCYQFLGQLSKQQKFDAAMQCFDQALKIDPKFTDALVGKGIQNQLLFFHYETFNQYFIQKSCVLNSNLGNALQFYQLLMILRDLQKFEESLVQYDQALKSSRFCSSGFVGKGLALSQI